MNLGAEIEALATGTYTVERASGGGYGADGRLVPAAVDTFAISAAVTPASGRDLQRLPEGSREGEGISILTSTQLLNGDRIIVDGRRFEVGTAEQWQAAGGFWSCVAIYDPTSGPPVAPGEPFRYVMPAGDVQLAAVEGLESETVQAAIAELASREGTDLGPVQAAIDALAAEITAESIVRGAMDTRLQTDIDSEAAARAAADAAIGGRVTANEASIADLLVQVAKAVLTSGDQSIGGTKTFLAQAILSAGASLPANVALSWPGGTLTHDGTRHVFSGTARAPRIEVSSTQGIVPTADGTFPLGGSTARFGDGFFVNLRCGNFVDVPGGNFRVRTPNADATQIIGRAANGASAVGVILNAGVALTAAGARITSEQNGGVEKSFVDKDGQRETLASGAFFDIARSPNGTRYGISVSNAGTVVATPL